MTGEDDNTHTTKTSEERDAGGQLEIQAPSKDSEQDKYDEASKADGEERIFAGAGTFLLQWAGLLLG